MNRKNLSGKTLSQTFLIILLVLTACTNTHRSDDPQGTNVNSNPQFTIESGTLVQTEADSNREDIAIALVQAKVRDVGGYDQSVTILVKQETSVISLPGLKMYSATPMVVDIPDDRCAIYGEEIWCFQEALQNIIKQFSLGSNPGQLSNDEWLGLIAFFTYTIPINGPEDLENIPSSLLDNERIMITEPQISRSEIGGIEISFYFEVIDYMGHGDLSLNILDAVVTEDNLIFIEHREVWVSPGSE